MSSKQYVSVTARFHADGTLVPLCINWSDGRKFPIDKIIDMRRAASLKAGGAGVRYTCMIGGRERYLFFEDTRWFVEGRGME